MYRKFELLHPTIDSEECVKWKDNKQRLIAPKKAARRAAAESQEALDKTSSKLQQIATTRPNRRVAPSIRDIFPYRKSRQCHHRRRLQINSPKLYSNILLQTLQQRSALLLDPTCPSCLPVLDLILSPVIRRDKTVAFVTEWFFRSARKTYCSVWQGHQGL